jgi:hypothetical protein
MSEPTEPELDAYALLSKPTLDLSDAEVERIVIDLQQRRKLYLSTGKPDVVKKPAAAKAKTGKASDDEKKRNTELLLGKLKMSLDAGKPS